MDILFQESYYQESGQACLADLTPPVFSGIASLLALDNGALRAAWLAATDASPPIRYRIFIQSDTPTGLFASQNRVSEAELGLQTDIFHLANGSYLQADTTYYVGVRAVDAVGNEDSNSASLSEPSSGVPENSVLVLLNKIVEYTEAVDKLRLESEAITGILEVSEATGVLPSDELTGTVEECV